MTVSMPSYKSLRHDKEKEIKRAREIWIRSTVLLSCTVIIMFFCLRAGAEDGTLKKASFIPQWVPQAQFAGYYVGLEKGIYKRHGIDLKIISGGPDRNSADYLVSKKADFTTMWLAAGIEMRAKGQGVINISQIMQRSALMLVAKKANGILTPQDMDGKKVGLWGEMFQLQPKAFFKKYDIHVDVVPQSFSVNLFLRDGVAVASAMWYNEYHTILNAGIDPDELTTFFFHEHGLNFPEDGIYTLEETLQRDPDLCCRFVNASIEGWLYAFDHPDEALDIVMKNLSKEHVPSNRVHQRWMLRRMQDLILPDAQKTYMGTLVPDEYYGVANALKENGFIDSIPPIDSFYIDCHEHNKE